MNRSTKISAPDPGPIAGSGLLHPVALVAIATLVLNDHVLKTACPGFVTGKLSDAAGMVFFPLLLQGAAECIPFALGRAWLPSRRVLVMCALATAVTLAAVKLSPGAGEMYRLAWGLMQWPFRAANALFAGGAVPGIARVALVQDATDVWTVPFVSIAVLAGWSRCAAATPRVPVSKPMENRHAEAN